MTKPAYRRDFSRGEAVAGLTWLSVGGVVAGLVAAGNLTFPSVVGAAASLVIAAWFTGVLTRTALLWTGDFSAPRLTALAPAGAWAVSFALFRLWLPVPGDDTPETNNIRAILSVVVAIVGVLGGVWPVVKRG